MFHNPIQAVEDTLIGCQVLEEKRRSVREKEEKEINK